MSDNTKMSGSLGAFFINLRRKLREIKIGRDLPVFFVFLIISTGFWVLKSMNEEYETNLEISVDYINLPKEYVFSASPISSLQVTVKATGNALVRYRSTGQALALDMEDMIRTARRSNDGRLYVLTDGVGRKIQRQIGSDAFISAVFPDTIYFSLSGLARKKVPVIADVEVQMASQLIQASDQILIPSEVEIYGPNYILDSIHSVQTEKKSFKNITDTLHSVLTLKNIENVEFSTKSVEITIPLETFTEKVLSIPVISSGFPDSLRFRSFPGVVSVSFFVGLSRFNQIVNSAITVEIPYASVRGISNGSVIPNVVVNDKWVRNVRVNPERIDYIIELKK